MPGRPSLAPKPAGASAVTILGRLEPRHPATILRPVVTADDAFCRALFYEDRALLFGPLGPAGAALATLIERQYAAQHISHRRDHPEAEYAVIVHSGIAVGRLVVAREVRPHDAQPQGAQSPEQGDGAGTALHLADIIVAVAARGRGIGSDVITSLRRAAPALGASCVTLSVACNNHRAIRLFTRLGFVTVQAGSHVRMVATCP